MKKTIYITILISLMLIASYSFSAVGCSLKNPDRDVRMLFPESTNYKTYFKNLKSKGGSQLKKEVEAKLKDSLDDYTEYEVDYAYYKVLKGDKPIGFIFGTNQKGKYGNIQIIVATTLDGQIKQIYFQSLSAPYSKKLKSQDYKKQYVGLSLRDFYLSHGQAQNYKAKDRVSNITAVNEAVEDHKNTLRGIKKLLILYDIFWLNKAYNRFYQN